MLAVPLLPLPVAYLTKRRGLRVGLASAFSVGVLALVLTGPWNGLMSLFLAGLAAVTMGWSFQRGWGLSRTLLATAGSSAGSLAMWMATIWVMTGMDGRRLGEMMIRLFRGVPMDIVWWGWGEPPSRMQWSKFVPSWISCPSSCRAFSVWRAWFLRWLHSAWRLSYSRAWERPCHRPSHSQVSECTRLRLMASSLAWGSWWSRPTRTWRNSSAWSD